MPSHLTYRVSHLGITPDSMWYRLWETILLGSIPIVESSPGLDRAYAMLPVLVVKNFKVVTPQLLKKAYPCFLRHANQFRFDHLREVSFHVYLFEVKVIASEFRSHSLHISWYLSMCII